MKTKKCSECGTEYPPTTEFFYRHKRNPDGLRYECKECCKKYIKIYRLDHKKEIQEWKKRHYKEHIDEIKKYTKKHYYENKERINVESKKYYHKNKEIFREKYRGIRQIYYQKHRCEKLLYAKNYRKLHQERYRELSRLQRQNDMHYKISCNLRSRIRIAIKQQSAIKSAHLQDLLGCSIDFLKFHLESQFSEGMSWANYGKHGWEIHHIKPCALFDLTKEEDQKKCFHWTNTKPLWQKDNSSINQARKSKN